MARLSEVVIDGFWGNHRVEFSVNSDVTFLIGVNGSGKSTVLSLIGAALTNDLETLSQTPFRTIELAFKQKGSRKKPKLKVSKSTASTWDEYQITFSFQESATSKPDRYRYQRFGRRSALLAERAGAAQSIEERSRALCKTTWITVHRSRPYATPGRPERIAPSLMDL